MLVAAVKGAPMDWSDVFAWAMGRTAVALVGFISIFFFNLPDGVRKIRMTKQALAWLGWCLGSALALAGALGFAVTLLLSVLSWVEFGRFFGPYPARFFSAYAIDMIFGAVGAALWWALRNWEVLYCNSSSKPERKSTRQTVKR